MPFDIEDACQPWGAAPPAVRGGELRDGRRAGGMAKERVSALAGFAHRLRRAADPHCPPWIGTMWRANPGFRGEIGNLRRENANLRRAIANLTVRFEICGYRLPIDGLRLPIAAPDWQSVP